MMIVHLLAPVTATGDLVGFRSRIGAGNGRWQGSGPHPADVGVDVELDIRGVVDWSTAEISSAPPVIQVAAAGTLVRGRVTDLTDDGVLGLELGGGSIRLDMDGEPPLRVRGRAVAVVVPLIYLYPTAI